VERELGADEIRRQLHNESIMKSLNESPQAIQRALNETADAINDINQPPKA
jgi:sec-independent protein translocase protein TatB